QHDRSERAIVSRVADKNRLVYPDSIEFNREGKLRTGGRDIGLFTSLAIDTNDASPKARHGAARLNDRAKEQIPIAVNCEVEGVHKQTARREDHLFSSGWRDLDNRASGLKYEDLA